MRSEQSYDNSRMILQLTIRRQLVVLATACALSGTSGTTLARVEVAAAPARAIAEAPALTVVGEAESSRAEIARAQIELSTDVHAGDPTAAGPSAAGPAPSTAAPVPGTSTPMLTPAMPAPTTVRPTEDDPSADRSAQGWLAGALVLGLLTGGVIAWRRSRAGTGHRPVPPDHSGR